MAMHIWLHCSDRLCVCHHLLFNADYSNYPFYSGQWGSSWRCFPSCQFPRESGSRNRCSQRQSTLLILSDNVYSWKVSYAPKRSIHINIYIYCRFIGVLILNYVDPALLLSFYGVACCVFSLGVALATGNAGIGCLFALFFFESICYPACFSPSSTEKNLTCQYLVYFYSGYQKFRCPYKARLRFNRHGKEQYPRV